MEANSGGQSADLYSERACAACKKHKRQCDKTLPQCDRCRRSRRTCEYADLEHAPTANDIDTMRVRLDSLEDRLTALSCAPISSSSSPCAALSSYSLDGHMLPTEHGTQEFEHGSAAALFLDIDYFATAGLALSAPKLPIPMV